jgi:hypothetical protein
MRENKMKKCALIFGLSLALCLTACSEEGRAKRALNSVIHEEIDQFNKYHLREVKPKIYESSGQFYRVYHEREDAVPNMRRTNSVDTPYIATINFTENIYLTRKHRTWEDSHRDIHFILSNSVKRELVYTFASGSWRKKEIY